MLLSLFTMFMHLSLYIRNILLSVMVIDHSVMQTFSIEEKELAWPRIFRMKFSGSPKTKSTKYSSCVFFLRPPSVANKQWKNLVVKWLETRLFDFTRPPWFPLPIFPYWLQLTFLWPIVHAHVIRHKQKIRLFVQLTDEFFLIHHQIDNIKMGIVFYMKIRTFLQIVRSGKITASQKANLSINKKVVTHEFKICIEHNMLFRLIDKYSLFNQRFFEGFEFADNLEGLCQVSLLAVFNFLRGIYICMNIENRTSCYICKTNLLLLPNTQGANLPTYWQTCHFLEVNIFVTFKKQSVPVWGHNFFRKEQINPKSLFPHSKNK